MKVVLFQLAVFLCFGMVAGAAISATIDYRVERARQQELAKVYLSFSMKTLTEISL